MSKVDIEQAEKDGLQYNPEDTEFNHIRAYEAGGEMKLRIDNMMALAREHGAPVIVCAAVDNLPDENTTMLISVNERVGLGLPNNLQIALSIMRLDNKELEIIQSIISLIEAAKINVEQVQDNIKAATANVVEMLKNEGLDANGQPLVDENGNEISVN